MTRAALAMLVAVAASEVLGCSAHITRLAPSQAAIAQIGLPVYPGARPIQGNAISQTVAVMHINSLSMNFMTKDPMDRIVAFYQQHLPKNAQRISVPMGFANDVTYQFYRGPYQKQVSIVSLKDVRMISLRSMQLLQTPAPSTSP